MCKLQVFTGINVHWGRSGAKAPPGALKRAIYSKNFLQGKGGISDKESISGMGSISDKESISSITLLRIVRVHEKCTTLNTKHTSVERVVHNTKHQTHISGACLASPTMKSTSNLQERVTHQ